MDRRKRQRRSDDTSTAAPEPAGELQQCCTQPQQQQLGQQQVQGPGQHSQQLQHADAPGDQQLLHELPEALLTQIVLAGGTQRHLHGVLAAVCQDWRGFLLQNTKQLSVGLTSQAGAASLALWLQQHAAALEQLHMATVGLFGRNCNPEARLQLFQALHRAAAGGAGAASQHDLCSDPHASMGVEPGSSSAQASGSAHSSQSSASSGSQHEGSGGGSQNSEGHDADNDQPGSGSGSEHDSDSDTESDTDSGSIEGHTDSPVPTPVPGGLFAGCAHLSTPSPSGDLFAAAAAAAAATAGGGAAAAAASPHTPRGGTSQQQVQLAVQQQQDRQQQQERSTPQQPGQHQQQHTPSSRHTPRRRSQQQRQPGQELPSSQQPQRTPLQYDQPLPQEQQQQPRELQLQQLSANMRLTPADCAAIASLPAPRLCSLQLQGSRTRKLAIDGVRCLAAMTQLTNLKLQQFSTGDDATVLLAKSLTGLQLLCLSGNNIGAVGAAAIAQHCTKVQQLDLSINRVNAAALASICATMHRLRDLNLAGNGQLNAAALQHLQQLTVLSRLTVSSSALNNQDLSAVCSALPQLQYLDAGNNRITKADPLTALVSLTSLNLSRNPLQLNCSKILAGMPLQNLALFDAAPARAISHLAGAALTQHLTSLTLGSDPSTNPEGSDESLQLAKTRTCGVLFGALAEAGKLQVLSVPCTGLGDAQAKLLSKLGASLQVLNVSYNCLSPAGLKVLRELPRLERLELRAMRPELPDAATANIISCTRLTYLDLAHNDISSEGVKQLGNLALGQLQHLDLRNNAQVEKWALLAAAPHLTRLTYLNLMEISDVRARAFPRPTGPGARSAAGPGGAGLSPTAAARSPGGGAPAAGASPVGTGTARRGQAAAAAAAGGAAAGVGGVRRPHADIWTAFPNLEELSVEAENGFASRGSRGGRVMLSAL